MRRAIVALMVVLLTLTALMPQAGAAPLPVTTLNEPPTSGHEIVVFPQRDFVSVNGIASTDTVTVEVHHSDLYKNPDGSPIVISSLSGLVPQDDPATPEFDGIVEVNHPGAYVWGPVTPDIRPGDKVRVVVDSGPNMGVAQQTTVANVTAKRPVQTAPGTVEVHGTAAGADGTPLPIGSIEHRLISAGNLFAKNDRRALRAPVDGTIAFDPVSETTNPKGVNWTATYTGLSPEDVTRALEAESRGMWLGGDPAAGAELTIFEIGAGVTGGPQGPGNGPLEKLPPPPGSELTPPSTPAALEAAVTNSNTVTLKWPEATDNVGVTSYGVYRNGAAIANVQNPDGSAIPPTTYVDKNVPPGTYTYTVDAADEVGNRSGESPVATATTTVQQAVEVPVNEPPANGIAMTVFPSRDFTEIDGIPDGQVANVEIIRGGRVISTADGVIPTGGVIEVNHPGGACWDGVTPEIRANDVVRVRLFDKATGEEKSAHQIHVANVSAAKAVQTAADDPATGAFEGEVQIEGFAQGHDGKPLPLGEIEARLVSSSADPFGKNGRRTLRAPEDGTLSYDKENNPLGTKFTATFSGLDAADVKKALEVEARIMWLGRDPLAGLELTIYEAGSGDPPGPSAGFCTSPIEAPDMAAPSAPTGVVATPDGPARTTALTWAASTDDQYVYGYRISRDGKPIANVDGKTLAFTDTNVPPGPHSYTVRAFDSASGLGDGLDAIERLTSGQGKEYGNLSEPGTAGADSPDTQAPTVPADVAGTNPSPGEVRLDWNPSTDDGNGPVSYRVYKGDTAEPVGTVAADAALVDGKVVFSETGLEAGAYVYRVEAVDGQGNASARSAAVTVNVTAAPDTAAPTVPADLKATSPDPRGKDVVLAWAPSTDEVGVTGYGIYRNSVRIATVGGDVTTYRDTNLGAGTHEYTVDAVDSAANRSEKSAADKAVIANDPPLGGRAIIAFPARDFVEGDGYAAGENVKVEVLRQAGADWKTVATASATADAAGLVEVNHAGPGCWTTNTPDIRGGDIVRIVDSKGVADQTVTQELTVQRPAQTAPGTVVVKGTAKSALGLPVDAGRLEHRLVTTTTEFAKSGTKKLLTGADGTLTFNADGTFTATYTGLSAADVTRAVNSESIINWLGRDALAGNELTIMENGPGTDGGPAAGACTAPLEAARPQASWTPGSLAFGDQGYLPTATTGAPRTVTLTNSGSAEMKVSDVYLAGANPGDYKLGPVTLPATLAPGQSLKVDVSFAPTALGSRPATLAFGNDAANTTYQIVVLSGQGVDTAPAVPAAAGSAPRHTLLGQPTAPVQMSGGQMPVRIDWTASSGNPRPDRYELEVSVAGGAYVKTVPQPAAAVKAQDGTITTEAATTARVSVNPSQSHRYRVKACNAKGCSAYTTAAAFTLAPFQEGNGSISQNGTWSGTQALSGAFGGSVRQSSTAGSRAQLRTTGIGFQVVSTKGPNRGNAEVWVDGRRVATVNLYAASLQPATVVYSQQGLANTTHTVELRVLGTRTAPSTGNRVDLDGFIALR